MKAGARFAAALAVAALATAHAASTTAQCEAVTTCYLGGSTSTPCVIADGDCAPCVTFSSNNGCYVKVDGECPFGTDCESVWYGSTSGSTSGSASTTGSTGTGSASTTGSTSTTGSGSSTGGNSTASGSSSGSAGTSGDAGTSSGSGSDMSVVFAIIGAAIGVIAVAVIFLTLVRRSRAARDDDDDMANTPPAFAKNNLAPPNSTAGASTYASYGRATANSGASSTGIPTLGGPSSTATMEVGVMAAPSSGVMSYYSQQPPQNSAAPSPRMTGRAFPTAAPMGVSRSSQPGNQYANAMPVAQPSYQPEPVKTAAPPTPLQNMGGAATSPRTRRESYEF